MSFSALVSLRVVRKGTYSRDTAAIRISHKYEYQLVLFLTCPYYSKTPAIFRRYIPGTPFFTFDTLYIHEDTDDRTSLRFIPPVRSISWCHIYVVSRTRIPAY